MRWACGAPRTSRPCEKLAWREETRRGVALLVRPDAPTETYRRALDVTDATNVVPGTHATARLAWERQRAGRAAFAGMTALLFATPLLVAAMRGLLPWTKLLARPGETPVRYIDARARRP